MLLNCNASWLKQYCSALRTDKNQKKNTPFRSYSRKSQKKWTRSPIAQNRRPQHRNSTFRALDRAGIKYSVVGITEILRLMRHTDSGDYLQAPVVVTGDTHFSGFRPDRLKALAA
jgi:glutaredoxin-like protein NrdH